MEKVMKNRLHKRGLAGESKQKKFYVSRFIQNGCDKVGNPKFKEVKTIWKPESGRRRVDVYIYDISGFHQFVVSSKPYGGEIWYERPLHYSITTLKEAKISVFCYFESMYPEVDVVFV